MIDRRTLIAASLAALGSVDALCGAVRRPGGTLFCASAGPQLLVFAVDQAAGRLVPVGAPIALPADVQFAWQHPHRPILYIASSDQNTEGRGRHHLSAAAIAPDGAVALLGEPVAVAARPIHITVDHAGRHILTAYNRPSGLTVHRIAANGSVGAPVDQGGMLDTGVYPHQVRVFPDDRAVLLVTRGNDARGGTAEDPGALRIFDYRDGSLRNAQTVAPGGGYAFRPRHADFHPSARWLYVDLESQNQAQCYAIDRDRLSPAPRSAATTLPGIDVARPGQLTSAIRVHPRGNVLYVVNRGTGTEPAGGRRIANGGLNDIAVFAIDRATGDLRHVQSIDVRGIHARTMDVSPDGDWLVAASVAPGWERRGGDIVGVPAGVSLFRVAANGRLSFASKHVVNPQGGSVFWAGAVRP